MIPILLGTHEYEWTIKIFADLFSKYYGDEEVIYFGDRQEGELPFNIKFQPVPCFPEGNWPWEHWFGQGLISVCERFIDNYILFFLPDHWLNQPVDKSIVNKLENYLISHPNVIRANLTDDLSWHYWEVEQVEVWNGLEIIEVKPWSIHAGFNGGLTFCPSLWNPRLLSELISSHWTLWDCERLGTEIIKIQYPKIQVVGSNPAALTRTHGLFHGQKNKVSLNGLSEEDKQIVMKYLPEGYLIC